MPKRTKKRRESASTAPEAGERAGANLGREPGAEREPGGAREPVGASTAGESQETRGASLGRELADVGDGQVVTMSGTPGARLLALTPRDVAAREIERKPAARVPLPRTRNNRVPIPEAVIRGARMPASPAPSVIA